ncbi:MAG TPA: wax ester/triacylglycerol synthase family O-acyltransferase [Candidatus Limnocylindrales bacterium]|nr:wax ester/triacylglycerol synthase family O-acyltransferase [Candidatus Limnocylindrales bacterium]
MRSRYDRLTIQDRNQFWAEARDTPMHIMAVLQLEPDGLVDGTGRLKLEVIRDRIERRLARVPRLRQVVRPGNLLTGPPIWVDDPGFDLARHVRAGSVPGPGTETDLLQVVARIDRDLIDRAHALWEAWLLTGLDNGRVALVFKLHHAIADGLAAIQVLASLFDFTSDSSDPAPGSWVSQPPPRPSALMRDNLAGKIDGVGRALARARHPRAVWHASLRAARAFRGMVGQATRAPRSPLNRTVVGPARRLAVVRIPLDEAKAVAHVHGGTVNDVLLSIVAGGLRSLLLGRSETVEGVALLASVPVSIRHDAKLGNEVGLRIVPLPLGEAEPAARLWAVVQASTRAKHSQSAAAGMVGWSMVARVGLARWVSRHQRFVNVFVTNVAGPPMPVCVLGARLLDVIPVVPIAGNCPLAFAALSYHGVLAITVTADAGRLPDLDVAIQGLERSWLAMRGEKPVAVMAPR